VSLNLSSTTCNILENFYPTKQYFSMFSYLSVRNF
jgi:hypothetical protein